MQGLSKDNCKVKSTIHAGDWSCNGTMSDEDLAKLVPSESMLQTWIDNGLLNLKRDEWVVSVKVVDFGRKVERVKVSGDLDVKLVAEYRRKMAIADRHDPANYPGYKLVPWSVVRIGDRLITPETKARGEWVVSERYDDHLVVISLVNSQHKEYWADECLVDLDAHVVLGRMKDNQVKREVKPLAKPKNKPKKFSK